MTPEPDTTGADGALEADPDATDHEPSFADSASLVPDEAEAERVDATDSDDFTPEQIDALVAERDEFLEAYRRTAADFDNFRKLAQRRLADEVTRSQGAFVERLLPVLDAVDAARAQGAENDAAGVEAVAGALYAFLEREGLARVDPVGEVFDPNVAEAVVHEPGDPDDPHGEPVVSEVLRTGYLWQGRVIRAAMVKVSG